MMQSRTPGPSAKNLLDTGMMGQAYYDELRQVDYLGIAKKMSFYPLSGLRTLLVGCPKAVLLVSYLKRWLIPQIASGLRLTVV